MIELRELRLGSNSLDDWSSESWSFPSLEVLDLSSNKMGEDGSIPGSLFLMESLVFLSLADNSISEVLPNIFGLLRRLEALDLSYNSFGGTIPAALGNIRDLRMLRLQANDLTGEIPRSLRKLRRIELLRLDSNKFEKVDAICRAIEDSLIEFYADCSGEEGIECPCCTHCCDSEKGCHEKADSTE
jgi:Leucine-rich repeat (LRR) protein